MVKRRVSRPGASDVLLFADSERNADQLYFSGIHVPDPFISMRVGGRRLGVFNALEFGRAMKESSLDEVMSLEEWQARAQPGRGAVRPSIADVVRAIAREMKVRKFQVAGDFPVALADRLRTAGIGIMPVEGGLFPAREIKSAEEVRAIVEGNKFSALGLRTAESMLRRAVVRGRRLFLDERVLTSERVREAVEIACLRGGAVSAGTIVAGGDQACDPHCRGHGPLRPGELIIVDVFPRVTATGFHGDMTRTFLKGSSNDSQVKLVDAVRAVQKRAIGLIEPRAEGKKIHEQVCAAFDELGFRTARGADGSTGFFHGTGHGLGLAVHEAPSIGRMGTTLGKGAVVTVEPGLYYPGLGGCRIEDVVQVMPGKPRMLSRFHYRWIIE